MDTGLLGQLISGKAENLFTCKKGSRCLLGRDTELFSLSLLLRRSSDVHKSVYGSGVTGGWAVPLNSTNAPFSPAL